MTTEQKFKRLLDIAIANGYEIDEDLYNGLGKISGLTVYYDADNPHTAYGMWSNKSLNDLVLNTSFFECLFKDALPCFYTGNFEMTIVQQYKLKWVLEIEEGTALEWLFKQFGM